MNNFLFGSAKVVDKGESSQLKEAAGGSQQLTLVSVSAVGPTATTNTSREKQNVARGGIEGGGGLSLDEDRLRARLAEEEKETALAAAAAEVAVQESNLLTVATASASTGPAGVFTQSECLIFMFCVTLLISARKYFWESRFSAKRYFYLQHVGLLNLGQSNFFLEKCLKLHMEPWAKSGVHTNFY